VIGDKIVGIAVHIGARGAAAEPGEVLVSSTVKDLVACPFHLFVRSDSGGPPLIFVMQAADARYRYHPILARPLHPARFGCVFRER
jgi:hypothetical protein